MPSLDGLNYHSLTAAQRRALERERGYTRDDGSKLNYTPENGRRPDLETPKANIYLHIHKSGTDDEGTVGARSWSNKKNGTGYEINDDDPAAGTLATSTTSGREPGLAGEDIEDRVEALERAVVVIAQGGDLDDGGDDDQNSFTTGGSSNVPDPSTQLASQHVRQQSRDAPSTPTDPGANWQEGVAQIAGGVMGAMDQLPDSPADINARNARHYYGASPGDGRQQDQPGRTDNGIDVGRRLSTGAKRLDPGKTSEKNVKGFGLTADAKRKGNAHRHATFQSGRLIRSINRANAKFYRQGG